jgi:hypothetical protein
LIAVESLSNQGKSMKKSKKLRYKEKLAFGLENIKKVNKIN